MNILEKLDTKKTATVFGWPLDTLSKAAQLAQKIDISHVQKTENTIKFPFEKSFFDVAEYLYFRTAQKDFPTTRLDHLPKSIKSYAKNHIYIGHAPAAHGSWAQVDLDVFCNGKRGIIKHMNEERQPEDIKFEQKDQYGRDILIDNIPKADKDKRKEVFGRVVFFTQNLYELIIQEYLVQHARVRNLTIPKLYWVRKNSRLGVDAFMQKSPGIFLHRFTDEHDMLIALAHVIKSLWQLQLKFHFMHRDFHAGNVSFDIKKYKVGIIDFGMSCINPNLGPVAWQSNNPDFYPLIHDSIAAGCTNRSMDVCCIIASLENAQLSTFLTQEYNNMVEVFTRKIRDASPEKKRQFMQDNYYTKIDDSRPWQVGNLISNQNSQHFWVYTTVEFPELQWFPEHFLKRLLLKLPLKDWFEIRKGIAKPFDSIMPQNVKLVDAEGKECTLVKLHQQKELKVKYEKETKLLDVNTVAIVIN